MEANEAEKSLIEILGEQEAAKLFARISELVESGGWPTSYLEAWGMIGRASEPTNAAKTAASYIRAVGLVEKDEEQLKTAAKNHDKELMVETDTRLTWLYRRASLLLLRLCESAESQTFVHIHSIDSRPLRALSHKASWDLADLQSVLAVADQIEGIASGMLVAQKIPPVKPSRKRGPYKPRTPTNEQLEALMVVGQCGKNFAEAGRQLKKDPKTVRDLYEAGLKNAGKLAPTLIGKPKVKSMPLDSRGQGDVAGDDDGPAPAVDGSKPRVRRNTR